MTLNAWTGKVNVTNMGNENDNRSKALSSIAGKSGDRKAKTKHVFADDGGNFVGVIAGSSIVIWSLHAAAPLLRIRFLYIFFVDLKSDSTYNGILVVQTGARLAPMKLVFPNLASILSMEHHISVTSPSQERLDLLTRPLFAEPLV